MTKRTQPVLSVDVIATVALVSRIPDRRFKSGYREVRTIAERHQLLPTPGSWVVSLDHTYSTPNGVRQVQVTTEVARGNVAIYNERIA